MFVRLRCSLLMSDLERPHLIGILTMPVLPSGNSIGGLTYSLPTLLMRAFVWEAYSMYIVSPLVCLREQQRLRIDGFYVFV